MRRKTFFGVLLGCFLFVCCSTAAAYERIENFDVNIRVNQDSGIDVSETISYDTGGLERHGMFRDIRLQAYNGSGVDISGISCTDENDHPQNCVQSFSSGQVHLKIGDPARTFSGKKVYVIKYRIAGAIGYFDKYDEIYWNATGNNWPYPIENVHVSISLPDGASVLQSAGYYGPQGSKNQFQGDGKGSFKYSGTLYPGSGVTIAAGFTKGVVKQSANPLNGLRQVMGFIIIAFPLVVFLLMFRQWNLYGKDPVSNRPIIPQYDAPDNVTPLEASAIVSQEARTTDISAEIIHLAISGYINIERTEEKVLFFNSEDYILHRLPCESPLCEADKEIMAGLFGAGGNHVKISELREEFYAKIPGITSAIAQWLEDAGYYVKNPRKAVAAYIALGILLLFGAFFLFAIPGFKMLGLSLEFAACASVAVSGIIIIIFGVLMPVRTDKGLLAREHLLGLKEYLNVAEKDRINFHNAPQKKPEVFEKFLPYAMIFGVEKAWAREFEGIYTQPTGWYSYSGNRAFSAIVFADSMRHFSNYANSALSSAPSSSGGGSGGGGFSGGGGGGGGGGSW